MASIIIHTNTKAQTNAIEHMAKAMVLYYTKEKDLFTEEFSKAIDLKLAEKLAIKKVKLVWKKSF